jgi:hypothetical protein
MSNLKTPLSAKDIAKSNFKQFELLPKHYQEDITKSINLARKDILLDVLDLIKKDTEPIQLRVILWDIMDAIK